MKDLNRSTLQTALEEIKDARKEGYVSEGILADVQARLEAVLNNSKEEHTSALQDSIQHFEKDHPSIASGLRTIIQSLSNMGI
jgi:hypothetical protein